MKTTLNGELRPIHSLPPFFQPGYKPSPVTFFNHCRLHQRLLATIAHILHPRFSSNRIVPVQQHYSITPVANGRIFTVGFFGTGQTLKGKMLPVAGG